MSVTSRITFQRSAAQQPAANLYGPLGASALSGGSSTGPGPSPSSATLASATPAAPTGASFVQVIIGIAILIGIWWAITLILERLLPLRETPSFIREFLHGLRIALIVAVWFVLWKMTAGVAPFNQIPPYVSITTSV